MKKRQRPGRLEPAARQLVVAWVLVACPVRVGARCLALEGTLPRSGAHRRRVAPQLALGGHSAAVELESAVRVVLEATRSALAATRQGARLERAAQPRAPVELPPAGAHRRPAAARLKAEVLGWAGPRGPVA